MKNLFYLMFTLLSMSGYSQTKETFKIFGAKLKPEQVLGIQIYNDVGFCYYTSPIINSITDDTTTYFLRMGTMRINSKDVKQGTKNLFNLSYSAVGNYPILDKIDFEYYKKFGFEKMELDDPSLLNISDYKAFKKKIIEFKNEYQKAREFLWLDENATYRNKLLRTRFFVNSQQIKEDKKLRKHFSLNVSTSLKANINKIIKGLKGADASASAQVDAYIDNVVAQHFNVIGHYGSIVFQEEYINEICFILENTPPGDLKDDEFAVNLKYYLAKENDAVALNSGILFFQFNGAYDKTKISSDTISSFLHFACGFGPEQAATIGATLSLSWAKQLDETFSNSFSKVWVIRFGTHCRIDSLHLQNEGTRPINPSLKMLK